MAFSGFMSRMSGLFRDAAEEGAGAEMPAFAGPSPKEARVLRNGSWTAVPVRGIRNGETVRIEPGEVVSVPGIVTSGETVMDMSMLIGWPATARVVEGGFVSPGQVNVSSAVETAVSYSGRMPSVDAVHSMHGTVDAES